MGRRFSAVSMFLLSCISAATLRADVVSQWNQQVITSGGPQIQRTLAMVHIAMFDAANAIERGYSPYLASLPEPPVGASSEAAAASAAHGILVRLFPSQASTLAATLSLSLDSVQNGQGETDGVQYGDRVAQALYDARLGDNILATGPAYVSTGEPGDYQLTTPGPPQPVNTNAPNWIPFALQSVSQFRPNGPDRLSSSQYARDLAETQRLGGSVSADRTLDQEQIARWHTEQAQFQFNRIARAETTGDGRGLLEHARFFALLNIALADATASAFDAKYTYRFWRPSTAIRNADRDGNDDTALDLTWSPFLTTPPHPEYPAAHGVVQAAAARVMTSYFGNHYEFSTTAPAVPGAVRSYECFDAYVEEGSFARILGGMHLRGSLDEGRKQGKKVGSWILENYLTPLP